MLFDPARHEAIDPVAWDEARALAAIRGIVEDAQAALGAEGTWPWHPLDETQPVPRHKSLYLGASGVLWALWYLEREGAVTLRIRPVELIERVYRSYLDE